MSATYILQDGDSNPLTREGLEAALDALAINHESPFFTEKDPIEIIDRVQSVLEGASVMFSHCPDTLEMISRTPASLHAMCITLDTLTHALDVARQLIALPEIEDSKDNGDGARDGRSG